MRYRYQCTIGIIEDIEKAIINSKNYTVAHDGSKGLHTFFGSNGHSQVFSRIYEVYLDKRAKQYASIGDVAGLSDDNMFSWGLFDYDSAMVRLHFDYRKGLGEIRMKSNVVAKMEREYPSLMGMIKEKGELIEL